MLVDTHTHLQFPPFDADREEVLARARAAGVARLVVVGTDLADSRAAVSLAAAHPGLLWAAVGFHPCNAAACTPEALAEIKDLARRPEVVAIGEIGLDYHWDTCPRDVQAAVFAQQQSLALELDLPIIVHSRDAHADCYAQLESGGGFGGRVVLHCFSEGRAYAERFLARGCWLDLDGPVTYPKAADAQHVAAEVPLERLLLETDCPYLAPQRVRGKRCEPAHVRDVAEAVAMRRDMNVEEVIAATGRAAATFFGWEAA